MVDGDIFKKRVAFTKERFTTKAGIFSWLTITAIWYGLLVEYLSPLNNKLFDFWINSLAIEFVAKYFTWLSLSIIFTAIGLGIAFIVITIYKYLKRALK